MDIKKFFRSKIDSIKEKGYTPKFKVGDIVLNKKYIIVRKVIHIHVNGKISQYEFKDIHNPLKQSVGKWPVFKECIKIDSYYDKIDERAATVLYGVKK